MIGHMFLDAACPAKTTSCQRHGRTAVEVGFDSHPAYQFSFPLNFRIKFHPIKISAINRNSNDSALWSYTACTNCILHCIIMCSKQCLLSCPYPHDNSTIMHRFSGIVFRFPFLPCSCSKFPFSLGFPNYTPSIPIPTTVPWENENLEFSVADAEL